MIKYYWGVSKFLKILVQDSGFFLGYFLSFLSLISINK